MAVIGQPLTAPEAGWKRVETESSLFTYGGTWSDSSGGMFSGGLVRYSSTVGSTISFKFVGKKIRIVAYTSATSLPIEVNIDGVIETVRLDYATQQALVYDKQGLTDAEHTVVIAVTQTGSGSHFYFDSVDIEVDADLINTTTGVAMRGSVARMRVGDKIICRYTATSNAFGTFSELGTSQAALIPAASTATPNGSFYWICVGKDHLGRLKLVADRNIQHSISWDTLNTAGVATGSGRPLVSLDGDAEKKFTIRLLTGGVSATDKDNEWDKIIVGSTLNGTITAGDNAVWNWFTLYSQTSTASSASAANRAVRGNQVIDKWADTRTGTTSVTVAFRPVLLVELPPPPPPPPTKFLIQDGEDIKTYSGGWLVVGQAPATEEMFLTSGMLDPMDAFNNLDSLVSDDIQILFYITDQTLAPAVSLVPSPRLIMPTGDIRLDDVVGIDHFTLTATEGGAGKVRLITSPDQGVTWYTYSGGWVEIVPEVAAVGADGMTVSAFNSLTSQEWAGLVGTSKTIRFAYYVEVDSATDIAETDLLVGQFDMQGWWEGAGLGTHYGYRYPNNTTLRILLYADGSYKVNYEE